MPPKEEKLTKEQKAEMKVIEEARILRNKGWDELTQDEKIERIRDNVKDNSSNAYRQLINLQDKISQLENHSHKENGDIVVPLKQHSGGFGLGEVACGKSSGKVYF